MQEELRCCGDILEVERNLKNAVSEALKEFGSYDDDEIEDIMKILDDVGVKSPEAFEFLQLKDMENRGMKQVVFKILRKKFVAETAAVRPRSREERLSSTVGVFFFSSLHGKIGRAKRCGRRQLHSGNLGPVQSKPSSWQRT
ncbi:hypothetical protein V5799_016226 [Amblyomma americanum]|uniref:Uncharacterized protein n=1 Tax=Amblyomma americanum TaxID=6943 RepID=A0AAQ4F6D6_AMBAM